MLTNLGLVTFVKKARDMKAGYVYGTTGRVLTSKILEEKKQQYPSNIIPFLDFIRKNWMGKITYDCVGMIKAYIWENDNKSEYYDPTNDVSANGMFYKAKIKGPIDTMPDVPGLCVRLDGHIGVYIGDGKVVEARGTKYGVVETLLKDRPWTHWLECPYISYVEKGEEPPMSTLSKGSNGDAVKSAQISLNALGAKLETDGIFGENTELAVKAFQEKQQLEVTGALTNAELRMLFILVENGSLQTAVTAATTSISKMKKAYEDYKKVMEG